MHLGDRAVWFDCRFPADRRQASSYAFGRSGSAADTADPESQCSFILGSVPRPIRLPSISIKVRKVPYSAIWCMRYNEM